MTKAYSKALDKHLPVSRIIGELHGEENGPTMVFTAGIHGNEPSGVFALAEIFEHLHTKKISIRGSIYAIAGNLSALNQNKRFHNQDLNRLWSEARISKLENNNFVPKCKDEQEQLALYKLLKNILQKHQGPFYFMDLHTTSSPTIPFLTVNDSLINRKFTQQFPLPIILGIEEYIQGPLLSYINELGYVSFGYEAGQHDAYSAIENQKAFVYLCLAYSGSIHTKQIDSNRYYKHLQKACTNQKGIYEIYHRQGIHQEDRFEMQPGFSNFQSVKKGMHLARYNGEEQYAKKDTQIFMPLYQKQGSDAYFFIRPISQFLLQLSAWFRLKKLDRFLVGLPGVSWANKKERILQVNIRIASFYSKQIFHLLGYRARKRNHNYYEMRNREHASKNQSYIKESWY
ncbi:MAG: succinylglutamate desuccinylase/aspartoacylase family protein [Flavobacteriaceae bacterium]|nr:succinylglutamate desuccinylase/aspartoacylase family protein [Flavobacteriaceae bacterium]